MRSYNQFLVVMAVIASAVALLFAGCLVSPEQSLDTPEGADEDLESVEQLGQELHSTQEPAELNKTPRARNYGKADSAKKMSGDNAEKRNESSKADKEAARSDSCPKPEDGEMPQDKCPARGVEHGSPQPLDPADPPTEDDRPEAPTDSQDDDE